ncbi:Membrane-bound lytic murein transglycosylase A [hydrothermal vent metagenome]|uniref:peptidoglycan lytic exotransglycosylase n=1 Tax=hydrothermal vent metagenome TaxID=652676 RepID=A0A3B1C756_9ZZZZ
MWKYVFTRLALIVVIASFTGCGSFRKILHYEGPSMELAEELDDIWYEPPPLYDDMSLESLENAVAESIEYLERKKPSSKLRFGDRTISPDELIMTLNRLADIFRVERDQGKRAKIIEREFDIYRGTAWRRKGNALVTGYYQPVLNGSLTQDDRYRWPLYSKPDDLVTVNLGLFSKKLKYKRIVGRVKNGRLVPYHDRKAIDRKKALADKGIEIVWVDNPVDIFFLQIQGSGIVRFEDGEKVFVNYAATNGHRYKAIGRLLIKEGAIPREKMSMQAIRKWLERNPEEVERVLNYNKSYIFFRKMDDGPFGSTGAKLTPGRSAAFDPRRFPKGSVAHITVDIPVLKDGVMTGWKKVNRFIFNQDQGGAIKGSGRMDLFFGAGDEAAEAAGLMKQPGELYFLILKERQLNPE